MLGKIEEYNGTHRERSRHSNRHAKGYVPCEVTPVSCSGPARRTGSRLELSKDCLLPHGGACLVIRPVVTRTFYHATLGPRRKNLAQQHYLSGFGRRVVSAYRGRIVRQRARLHLRWRRTRREAIGALKRKVGLRNSRQKGRAIRVKGSINTCKNTRGKR